MAPKLQVNVVVNNEQLRKGLAEAKGEIVVTSKALERAAAAVGGDALIAAGHKYAAAIQQIGGAYKLTAAEAARYGDTIGKSIEKMEKMGKVVPTGMREMVSDLRAQSAALQEQERALEEQERAAKKSAAALEALNRTVSMLRGDRAADEALDYAKAINEIGRVSRISDEQQQRVSKSIADALVYYRRMGQEVPAEILKAKQSLDAYAQTAQGFAQKIDLKAYRQELKATETATDGLGASWLRMTSSWVSAEAIIGMAKSGFRALTGFIKDSVSEYANAERESTRLNAALRAQGQLLPAVQAQYNDLAESFQRSTVYEDDMIRQTEALLVQVGRVMPGQMKAALEATTNLAAGLGKELPEAAMAVAKAMGGSTTALSKLSPEIRMLAKDGMSAEEVLAALNRQFGGQAAAEVNTYGGAVKQLANAWKDIKEQVGGAIATDQGVKQFFAYAVQEAQSASAEIQKSGLAAFLETLGGAATPLAIAGTAVNRALSGATKRKPQDVYLGPDVKPLTQAERDAMEWGPTLEADRAKSYEDANRRAGDAVVALVSAQQKLRESMDPVARLYLDTVRFVDNTTEAFARQRLAAIELAQALTKELAPSIQRNLDLRNALVMDINKQWSEMQGAKGFDVYGNVRVQGPRQERIEQYNATKQELEQKLARTPEADVDTRKKIQQLLEFEFERLQKDLAELDEKAAAAAGSAGGLSDGLDSLRARIAPKSTGGSAAPSAALSPAGYFGGPGSTGRGGWSPLDFANYNVGVNAQLYGKGMSSEMAAKVWGPTVFPSGEMRTGVATGGGSGMVFNLTQQWPVMNDPRAVEEFSRMAESAIVAVMRRNGMAVN